MWELLQKLEDLGWKPYGKSIAELTETEKNVRLLTSLSSGLWQFVCENRKYGYTFPEFRIKNPKLCNEGIESVEKECNQNSYEYYIIESALCNEEDLEKFLLDNIKV